MQFKTLSHQELSERQSEYITAQPYDVSGRWNAESFRQTEGEPMTIRRAKALNAILDSCYLPVWPGELLVGCGRYHRNAAEDISSADEKARDDDFLKTIGGRSFWDHSDHHAPDYPTFLAIGYNGYLDKVRKAIAEQTDPQKIEFLQSVEIALEGASRFMRRLSERLRFKALEEPEYADLLNAQSKTMLHLAENPPRTFWEAVQLIYSFHSIQQINERWAMAFGRMDQYLYPLYQADKAEGRLSDDDALLILEHFFAKITIDSDVQNIAVGGVKPEDGSDAVNDLSYLILEACKCVGRPGGNVTARVNKNTPAAFLEKCAEVIRTGIGYPAMVNDEILINALAANGTPIEDARDFCFVGCIETSIPGKSSPWSDSRFNLLRCVNLALFNGLDTVTGKHVGLSTGEPETWEAFYEAFAAHMRMQLREHVEWFENYRAPIQSKPADFTSPLLSALTRDCIERGLDLNYGGSLYPGNHGVAGMGIGVTSDSLAAIKKFVYYEHKFTISDMRTMLKANFEGFERERAMLLKEAPKYGNDVADVDDIAVLVTGDFGGELLKYRTSQGGFYWGLMGANVQNIYSGPEVGATPDGRLAYQPLSDAASPTFGRDINGITSTIRSIAKLPYHLCPGGNVVNIKLHPSAIKGEAGLKALASLIRVCFNLGGAEMQFNTVDREVLRKAMDQPEDYRNLTVRVSGFSAYYTALERAIQEDILARTEHAKV